MTGPENQGAPDPNAQPHKPAHASPDHVGDQVPDHTQVSAAGQIPPPAAPGQFGQPAAGQFGQPAPSQYPQQSTAQPPAPGQWAQPGQHTQAGHQVPAGPPPQQFQQQGYQQPSGYAQPGAYPPPGANPQQGGYPQQQPPPGYGQPPAQGHAYQPFVTDPGYSVPGAQQSADGQQQATQATPVQGAADHGAFATMATPQRDRKPRLMLIAAAAIAAIAIALAVTAFVAPGFALQKKLSQSGLQNGVTTILTSSPPGGYQVDAKTLTDVSCPSGQKAKKNSTFNCTAKINGSSFNVPITVLDNDGGFQVGRPVAQN